MTRQNFYQGQSVAPEHLNCLQDYADKGHANIVSSILGYGVVNGFDVKAIDGHIIGVEAGLAFNSVGERLYLSEGKQVNLSQYIPNTGEKTIKLGIAIDYIQSNPVIDSMGETINTTWISSVQFITGESLDNTVFELAEITVNPVSITSIKRTYVDFMTLPKQVQSIQGMVTDISHPIDAPYHQIIGVHPDPGVLHPDTIWELVEVAPVKDIILTDIVGTPSLESTNTKIPWYTVERYSNGYQTLNIKIFMGSSTNAYSTTINFDEYPFCNNMYVCTLGICSLAGKTGAHLHNHSTNSCSCTGYRVEGSSSTGINLNIVLYGKWTENTPTIDNPQGVTFQKIWKRIA